MPEIEAHLMFRAIENAWAASANPAFRLSHRRAGQRVLFAVTAEAVRQLADSAAGFEGVNGIY